MKRRVSLGIAQPRGKLEWADILRDLRELEEVEVLYHGKRYLLRTLLKGVCGKVLQGAGVAIPPLYEK